jgi:thymidine phosphorylase
LCVDPARLAALMVQSKETSRLREISLEQIRVALLELSAGRTRKSDQVQFAFGVVFLAHELGLISDKESGAFEALINRHFQ